MDLVIRDAVVADADALARVIVRSMNHAFAGIVPEQCLAFTEGDSAGNWRRTLTRGLKAGEFLCVVEAGTRGVIGYVLGGGRGADASCQGVLKQLHVMPEEQRRGVGRTLVRYAAGRLSERGIHSMEV